MTSLACAFSARLVEVRNDLSSEATTLRTTLRAAGVPRISLVWPSNCGSARRTVTTAVSPSITSSLITSVSAVLSTLAPRIASLNVLVSAASKPLTWVPPFGVAITLTNERTSVSYAVSHRTATSTVSSRSISWGVMCPLSSSSGTVSVNVSVPCSRRMSVTGSPWERNSTNSAMPPSWRNLSSTTSGVRWSRMSSSSPGTMYDVCRARPMRPSISKPASLVKIWRSGQNRIRVPAAAFAGPALPQGLLAPVQERHQLRDLAVRGGVARE